jgi:hypothetical protein
VAGVLQVRAETLRSLANGSISGSFAAIGSALANPCRILVLTNDTDADMIFSLDGTNNHFYLASGAFKLFDFTSNRRFNDEIFALAAGITIYVKQVAAPSSGSVYVETIYGI